MFQFNAPNRCIYTVLKTQKAGNLQVTYLCRLRISSIVLSIYENADFSELIIDQYVSLFSYQRIFSIMSSFAICVLNRG